MLTVDELMTTPLAELEGRVRKSGYASLLHYAVVNESCDVIQTIVSIGAPLDAVPLDAIDDYDDDEGTPLHYAAINHRPQVTRVLLRAGANVNVLNSRGETVLEMYERYNQFPDHHIHFTDEEISEFKRKTLVVLHTYRRLTLFRNAVRARAIMIYWMGVTAEKVCGVGGWRRAGDMEAYENEFIL